MITLILGFAILSCLGTIRTAKEEFTTTLKEEGMKLALFDLMVTIVTFTVASYVLGLFGFFIFGSF